MEKIPLRQISRILTLVLACVVWSSMHLAYGWDRGKATVFATLPEGSICPEGIAVDKVGNIYTVTCDMPRKGKPGQLIVFGPEGKLLRVVDIASSSSLLLDVAFHPGTEDLLVVDLGSGQVLKVDPKTGESTVFMKITAKSPNAPIGTNALAFDREGNVYLSDSFQGIIWRTGPNGGEPVEWLNHDLLRTNGVPRFGANGLGFNKAEDTLFVANTGNRQIVRVPVSNGLAGKPEVFVNSVGGPDNLFVDDQDRIWVAANQADEIVVIDPTGRVVAKLGDFDGLDEQGAARGLLFPAASVRHGDYIYVTNLSFDLRKLGTVQTIDGQWAAETKVHTIVRISVPEKFPCVR